MKKFFALFCCLLPALVAFSQSRYTWKTVTAAGYTYREVTNDPTHSRFYTLENGLKVILAVNRKEPRVRALMGVRAGSNQDPDSNTGLAHYLEHLLFKGTDKIGTSDWNSEKVYLKSIDSLYEEYGKTIDPQRRQAIYAEIDRISGIAARYAIANEYDKIVAAMGGAFSNAHTSAEETIFEESVPSASLDKLLALQAERWRNPVFRLFHTELETVYEEKNKSLDNDGNKVNEAMRSAIFPTHNYGQHSTIGTVAHLKNPSPAEIRKFYDNYYVPGNMAFVLAGDFDPDLTIRKIDKAFSVLKPKPYPVYAPAPEKPISSVLTKEIYGPAAETVRIAFRSAADKTRDAMLADLSSSILSNGRAGLLDLDLNKQQKVLGSDAGVDQFKDYGVFELSGNPGQGQTLEEVKTLLLTEIDKLKRGEFDASLIGAIVGNAKLRKLTASQNNNSLASALMNDFIKNRGEKWDRSVAYLDEMNAVSKKEIVDFSNRFFSDNNYVVVYKRKGEDKSIQKVEKPVITAIPVNENVQSRFALDIQAIPALKTAPQWLDFGKDVEVIHNGKQEILYTPNKRDRVFRLYYYFDMGSYNDKTLYYAAQYLQFLGTGKQSAEAVSKQFYDLACNFNISVGAKTTTVSISGLDENFEKAAGLFGDLLGKCVPDEQALTDLKARIKKARANNKTNRAGIMAGLIAYAQYGPKNPFNYDLSAAEFDALTADQLTGKLHQLMNYSHKVLYYGPKSPAAARTAIQQFHPAKNIYTAYPPQMSFAQLPTDKNLVFFADYDMVQAEMRWVRNSGDYDPHNQAVISVFNAYFSQTLFQVMRESKALAYSTSGSYNASGDKTIKNSIVASVGSQADKFRDAEAAMSELLNLLPASKKSFDAAKINVINGIETQRIDQENILLEYLRLQKLGLNEDIRRNTYAKLSKLTFEDIRKFHQENFSGKPYALAVLGSEKRINMAELERSGPVKKVSLQELFGY